MRSLVMADEETGTLWSHLLGEAMAGKLKGTELERLPSAMTDWTSWKKQHPKTTVVHLSRTSKAFTKQFYRNPSRFVLGYTDGEAAKAWGFDLLKKTPIVNDTFEKTAVLVTFDPASSAPYLFHRTLFNGKMGNKKVLMFELKGGKLVDQQTGSEWNRSTGIAIAGRLKGQQLTPLPGIVSFKIAWTNFYPKSVYAKPTVSQP